MTDKSFSFPENIPFPENLKPFKEKSCPFSSEKNPYPFSGGGDLTPLPENLTPFPENQSEQYCKCVQSFIFTVFGFNCH